MDATKFLGLVILITLCTMIGYIIDDYVTTHAPESAPKKKPARKKTKPRKKHK